MWKETKIELQNRDDGELWLERTENNDYILCSSKPDYHFSWLRLIYDEDDLYAVDLPCGLMTVGDKIGDMEIEKIDMNSDNRIIIKFKEPDEEKVQEERTLEDSI